MLTYPQIDPVAFRLGPRPVYWYGLMYLFGFATFWILGRIRARREDVVVRPEEVGDLLFYGMIGVIVGGRLGYVLFYATGSLLQDPLMVFRIWEGGMSFHGGLIGALAGGWLYQRRRGWGFLRTMDFVAPLIPPGLFFGRIGNFINGELWGKPTDLPWAMVFPGAGPQPRHPSQLYEALLEGVVLFAILWLFSSRPRPVGAVSGLFLLCYGLFRFLIEFVRQPDPQLGYLAFGWVTMGQILSLPMMLAGAGLLAWAYRRGGARG